MGAESRGAVWGAHQAVPPPPRAVLHAVLSCPACPPVPRPRLCSEVRGQLSDPHGAAFLNPPSSVFGGNRENRA